MDSRTAKRIRRFTISGCSRPGWREASRTSWLILTAAVIPSSLHAESQLGSCKKLPWAAPVHVYMTKLLQKPWSLQGAS